MSKSSPTHVIDSFWSAFATRRLDEVFAQHMTSDCEFVMPGAPLLKGAAAIRGMFEAYVAAFPDFARQALHAIESDDTYAAETRFTGTHHGALRTPQGELPATGRKVSWQSADIVRVRDGKIASWHVYHDPMPLLVQLGVAQG